VMWVAALVEASEQEHGVRPAGSWRRSAASAAQFDERHRQFRHLPVGAVVRMRDGRTGFSEPENSQRLEPRTFRCESEVKRWENTGSCPALRLVPLSRALQ
jgi:hypothetical protein